MLTTHISKHKDCYKSSELDTNASQACSLFRLARLMSAIGSTVQRPICSIRRLGSTLGMAPCWSAAVQTRSLWGGEKKYTLFLYLFKKCLLVKRCGSGTYLDCPGKTSHGILCCKLDFVPWYLTYNIYCLFVKVGFPGITENLLDLAFISVKPKDWYFIFD